MYMLVLQTFLLMMAAFLLGATFACLLKRTFHRLAGNDLPAEALHVEVPPAVSRSATIPTPSPRGSVTREDAQRFERALHGDVAEAATTAPVVRQAGPVIEVQPLPVPPPPATAPTSVVVELPTSPSPQPDTRTYTEIAVASHDGSTLPSPGVIEALLAPPVMPSPAPEPLPVLRVAIPQPHRPGDAPDGPNRTYIEEAVRSGYVYTPVIAPIVAEYQLPEPVNLDHYEVPPAGESYASIAVGGGTPSVAPSTDVTNDDAARTSTEEALLAGPGGTNDADAGTIDPPIEVTDPGQETTLASVALATAAGIAAQRAAAGAIDDLTRIQGIDEVLASRLHYAGVTRFAQIAGWDGDDVRRMSQTLGFFGRVQDEYWIDQARALSGWTPSDTGLDVAVAFEPEHETGSDHATPAGAADIATAAAAAAAAALVATSTRAVSDSDAPSRAVKLADAIRENAQEGETAGRSGMTGLRSVRSGALLGEDAQFVRGDLDDLKRIRGIGVLIEKKLNSLGVTSYEQVANWSAVDVERISEVLDFKGRIERENWIEQARILASGGQTEFSRRVDRGEA